LPENAPAEPEIIKRAEQKGIRLYPFTTTCTAGEPDATMILLCFDGMTANEIEPGIALLSQICI
jgi:GntR family transcriptional regulator / MocR family aminotransferase